MINYFSELIEEINLIFFTGDRYKLVLQGLGVTLKLSFFAVIIGTILGFIIALMKMCGERREKGKFSYYIYTVLSFISKCYIDIIRGTPSVVQLLIMYFVIFKSNFGEMAAIMTFGINSSAYVAEIIRAGILAVDRGQTEGGRSLGFTYSQTMRYIIVPQAIKNILPALGNEFIVLIKETAIVGYISLMDLTKASDFIISRTYKAFIPLITIAFIYFIIIKIISKLLNMFEKRLRKSECR